MHIAYFTVRYPTLSQTFIQREITGLCQQGLKITIFTCSQWGKPFTWQAPHLFENSICKCQVEPMRTSLFCRALLKIALLPLLKPRLVFQGIKLLFAYRWAGLENFLATFWGVIVAFAQINQIKKLHIQALHAAWATLPATAAGTAAALLNLPFSFGAHAYDIYRYAGDGFLKQKLAQAAWVHTTTQTAFDYLTQIEPRAKNKIILARRGLASLPEFKPEKEIISSRKLHILSVGRLVPKKGHIYQLRACRFLKENGVSFDFKIIGDGPLRHELENERHKLGLEECVEFLGALQPEEVTKQYQWADILWHAGIIDPKGDRDGLPNVIGEAMAFGVVVLTSFQPGPLEAIIDGVTGIVADPQKPEAIFQAIQTFIQSQELQTHIRANARSWIEKNFMAAENTKLLAKAFHTRIC